MESKDGKKSVQQHIRIMKVLWNITLNYNQQYHNHSKRRRYHTSQIPPLLCTAPLIHGLITVSSVIYLHTIFFSCIQASGFKVYTGSCLSHISSCDVSLYTFTSVISYYCSKLKTKHLDKYGMCLSTPDWLPQNSQPATFTGFLKSQHCILKNCLYQVIVVIIINIIIIIIITVNICR